MSKCLTLPMRATAFPLGSYVDEFPVRHWSLMVSTEIFGKLQLAKGHAARKGDRYSFSDSCRIELALKMTQVYSLGIAARNLTCETISSNNVTDR